MSSTQPGPTGQKTLDTYTQNNSIETHTLSESARKVAVILQYAQDSFDEVKDERGQSFVEVLNQYLMDRNNQQLLNSVSKMIPKVAHLIRTNNNELSPGAMQYFEKILTVTVKNNDLVNLLYS